MFNWFCKSSTYLRSLATLGLYAVGLTMLCLVAVEPALAQQGGNIFQTAACNILEEVLKKDFGAMITAITGLLALIAAAAGSFKGAWALIFVSVGSFIFPGVVAMIFPGLAC